MKKYSYYSITDSNREVIHSTNESSLTRAIAYFAKGKRLTTNEFKKIYETISG